MGKSPDTVGDLTPGYPGRREVAYGTDFISDGNLDLAASPSTRVVNPQMTGPLGATASLFPDKGKETR